VRELRNVIERSAVLAEGQELEVSDLPDELRARRVEVVRAPGATVADEADILNVPYLTDFREARREFERAYLERCLIETGGNVTRAAERVGMHRQSLQQKLKDLGLTRRYVSTDEVSDSDDE
jgi:DNA-binding NtrC family response regulator